MGPAWDNRSVRCPLGMFYMSALQRESLWPDAATPPHRRESSAWKDSTVHWNTCLALSRKLCFCDLCRSIYMCVEMHVCFRVPLSYGPACMYVCVCVCSSAYLSLGWCKYAEVCALWCLAPVCLQVTCIWKGMCPCIHSHLSCESVEEAGTGDFRVRLVMKGQIQLD